VKKIENYRDKCTGATPKAAPNSNSNDGAAKKASGSAPTDKKQGQYTYTTFYNHIYDAIEPRKFSGSQYAVFMYIYRQTVGYQGRSIIFKSEDVAYRTKFKVRTIDKAYKSLLEDRIIKAADGKKKGVQINFMKSEWTPLED